MDDYAEDAMHGLLWALGLIVFFTVMAIFSPTGRRELDMLICVAVIVGIVAWRIWTVRRRF